MNKAQKWADVMPTDIILIRENSFITTAMVVSVVPSGDRGWLDVTLDDGRTVKLYQGTAWSSDARSYEDGVQYYASLDAARSCFEERIGDYQELVNAVTQFIKDNEK